MKLSTLAIFKDLEAAGFTKSQAESVAEKFADIAEQQRDELVTKDYLKAQFAEFAEHQRNEIANQLNELVTKDQLKAQFAEFSEHQHNEIAKQRNEIAKQLNELVTKDQLKAQIAEVSIEIRDSHTNTIKWLVGLLSGFLALILSFVYFLIKSG